MPTWLPCPLPSHITTLQAYAHVLSLPISFHLVYLVLFLGFFVCFFLFSCHVRRSIKTSNSFTSVCSLLYSVGLITTNYSLQLHRIQPHVVLTHISKGYVWGEGGTWGSRSKGTRHLLCQGCPTHSPFSFSLDPNWRLFPSRPATHMTAVFKAASLWHALLSDWGVNKQRRDYMKHFVTFVTSKQWLLDGTPCFLNHVCIIQGPGLHIPFMTIDMFSCDVQELGGSRARLTVFDKQLVLWWIRVQDAWKSKLYSDAGF